MRLQRNILPCVTGLVLTVSLLLTPAVAQAFSGYGSGTQSNPYRISTCSQLGEMANNLAGYYVLNNNINCNNATFSPIGGLGGSTPFTGTFDGLNHSIENINFNNCGIFCSTNNATIQNLTLASGTFTVPANYYHGSFVGYADSTKFTNLHSNLTFNGNNYDYIGGIAGFADSGDTISDSSFGGSVTNGGTDGYAGGIVGFNWEGGDTITNSYSTGSFSLTSGASIEAQGGIAGGENGGSISDSYSTATIHDAATGGNGDRDGGLVGTFSGGSVSNSFTASPITSTGTNTGAAFGDGLGTSTNNYFDRTAVGLSNCSGLDSASCTAVNVSNASPNYFFNNTTSAPLNDWDFTNTWSKTTSSYPILQNQAAFTISSGIPNSGDSNNDGTVDAYQNNVIDVVDSNSVWTTVTIPSGDGCIAGSGQSMNATSMQSDAGYTALNNPVDFDIYCTSVGATVPVTIIYDRQYTNPTLRFYNANTDTYSTVVGAQFSTVTIGGVARTEVTYNATDGGAYDSDGTANGVIVDPVGLVSPSPVTTTSSSSVTTPDTGYGAYRPAALLSLIAYSSLSLGLVSAGLLTRKYLAK